MSRIFRFLNSALLFHLMTSAASPQVLTANAELAMGMSAEKNGDYGAALDHLQRAVALDPRMINAHFALGTVADSSCAISEERCQLALEEYKKVLELDPSREDAMKNLAFVLYQVNRIDEAESYYRTALALNANDPDVLCGVAALNNRASYRLEVLARLENKLTTDEPLINWPFCREVRDGNLARVEVGIALLTRARVAQNQSTELMIYLAVLYRARAEIQCNNPKAYKADMNTSAKWYRMRTETLKRKADDFSLRECPAAPPPPPNRK
jgi:tetratricopeptide (TPR) repeat protein